MRCGAGPDHPNGIGHTYAINRTARRHHRIGPRVAVDKIGRSMSTAAVVRPDWSLSRISEGVALRGRRSGQPRWTFDMMAPGGVAAVWPTARCTSAIRTGTSPSSGRH